MKTFLTVFPAAEPVHLYKDVGMIPYSLAKHGGYKAYLLYCSEEKIVNPQFEEYVELIQVKPGQLVSYIRKNARRFDYVNVYHLSLKKAYINILFKIFNPACKVYLKLDLDQMNYDNLVSSGGIKRRILSGLKRLWIDKYIDVISVETKSYYHVLKSQALLGERLIYLPNGIQADLSEAPIQKEKLILTVGRLGTRQKNTEMLVNSFIRIQQERHNDWQLVLIGSRTREFDSFLEQCKQKYPWLDSKIILGGEISDRQKLQEWYKRTSVFALSSRWEGFCLVILEAMLAGDYIVSTRYAALPDLLADGEYGDIVEQEDDAGLDYALQHAMDNYPQCMEKARMGQKFLCENFLWSELAVRLKDELEAR